MKKEIRDLDGEILKLWKIVKSQILEIKQDWTRINGRLVRKV